MALRPIAVLALACVAPPAAAQAPRIATGAADFVQPGTQPSGTLVFEPAGPSARGATGSTGRRPTSSRGTAGSAA